MTGGETEAWRGEGVRLKVTQLSGGGAGRSPGLPLGGLPPGKEKGRDGWMDRRMGGALAAGPVAPGLGS